MQSQHGSPQQAGPAGPAGAERKGQREAELEAEGRRRAPWKPLQARVAARRLLEGGWVELVLHAPYVAQHARPGQFVEIGLRPSWPVGWDPFLRRPFSLFDWDPAAGQVAVVYRPGGRGTAAFQLLSEGSPVEVLGPLGRSFPEPVRPGFAAGSRLLVAGEGHGVLVLAAAARWASRAGRRVRLLAGGPTRSAVAALERLAQPGVELEVLTADGSAGRQGQVARAVEQALSGDAPAEVWASGPEPMLVAVKEACRRAGIVAYLNVERPMACGFGLCMGCSVPRASGFGYWHACVDGPVFRAEEVVLDGEPSRVSRGGCGGGR